MTERQRPGRPLDGTPPGHGPTHVRNSVSFLNPEAAQGGTHLERAPSLSRLHAQSSTETSGLGETVTSGFSSQESVLSYLGEERERGGIGNSRKSYSSNSIAVKDYDYLSKSGYNNKGVHSRSPNHHTYTGENNASYRGDTSPRQTIKSQYEADNVKPELLSSRRKKSIKDTGGRSLTPQQAKQEYEEQQNKLKQLNRDRDVASVKTDKRWTGSVPSGSDKQPKQSSVHRVHEINLESSKHKEPHLGLNPGDRTRRTSPPSIGKDGSDRRDREVPHQENVQIYRVGRSEKNLGVTQVLKQADGSGSLRSAQRQREGGGGRKENPVPPVNTHSSSNAAGPLSIPSRPANIDDHRRITSESTFRDRDHKVSDPKKPESGSSRTNSGPKKQESGSSRTNSDPKKPESGSSRTNSDPKKPESGSSRTISDPKKPESGSSRTNSDEYNESSGSRQSFESQILNPSRLSGSVELRPDIGKNQVVSDPRPRASSNRNQLHKAPNENSASLSSQKSTGQYDKDLTLKSHSKDKGYNQRHPDSRTQYTSERDSRGQNPRPAGHERKDELLDKRQSSANSASRRVSRESRGTHQSAPRTSQEQIDIGERTQRSLPRTDVNTEEFQQNYTRHEGRRNAKEKDVPLQARNVKVVEFKPIVVQQTKTSSSNPNYASNQNPDDVNKVRSGRSTLSSDLSAKTLQDGSFRTSWKRSLPEGRHSTEDQAKKLASTASSFSEDQSSPARTNVNDRQNLSDRGMNYERLVHSESQGMSPAELDAQDRVASSGSDNSNQVLTSTLSRSTRKGNPTEHVEIPTPSGPHVSVIHSAATPYSSAGPIPVVRLISPEDPSLYGVMREWERRDSKSSNRSQNSRGSVRSTGRFLGSSTGSAWAKWSRERRASYRRRLEKLEQSEATVTTTVPRISTPVKKARQEGLKFIHPDLEATYLSEDDLNELRRHKEQQVHAMRVIEKTRRNKYRMKSEFKLSPEQWKLLQDFWNHAIFVRTRLAGIVLSLVALVLMVVSVTHPDWLEHHELNMTIVESLWMNCTQSTAVANAPQVCTSNNGRNWQNAVIGMLIFSSVCGFLAMCLSVCGLFTSPLARKIYYFHSAAEIFVICALSAIVALILFSVSVELDTSIHSPHFRLGYGLGWLATVFLLASTVCMNLDDMVRESSRAKCCRWCWKGRKSERNQLRQV